MIKKITILISFFCLLCAKGGAQHLAVKNNVAYDALLTPNASLEVALGKKLTLDTQLGANFFFYEKDATSSDYKNKKWSHFLVQPELRLWKCEAFNGLFAGLHLHGGAMNVGGVDIPFILNRDKDMDAHRYEGYFYGAGVSAGYHWIISPRFSLEASLGLGYARIEYDRFRCVSCGEKNGSGSANYVGPTKAVVSLIFMLK